MAGVLVAGTACNSGRNPAGEIEIRVWDHREAIDDFQALPLTISGISVHPAGQPPTEGWVKLEPILQKLDLTQYTDGQEAVIAHGVLEAGAYDAIQLTVEDAVGTLVSQRPLTVTSRLEPVALDFLVTTGKKTTLGLDLVVLDISDHPGRGYELHIREATVWAHHDP